MAHWQPNPATQPRNPTPHPPARHPRLATAAHPPSPAAPAPDLCVLAGGGAGADKADAADGHAISQLLLDDLQAQIPTSLQHTERQKSVQGLGAGAVWHLPLHAAGAGSLAGVVPGGTQPAHRPVR